MINKKYYEIAILIIILTSIGTSLTYGYFYDSLESKADLNITTGNLKIGFDSKDESVITNPINMEGILQGETRSSQVNVINNGTLREYVTIAFKDFKYDFQCEDENDFLSNFRYELKGIEDTTSYNISTGTFKELKSREAIILLNPNTEKLIILQPGQAIKIILSITLLDKVDASYENKGFSFSIVLNGTQANDKWEILGLSWVGND